MPRARFPIDSYSKGASTPLDSPDTSSAVNYAQVPENIVWMSGDRGFMKRPGSLPFAELTVSPGETNYVCALGAVQTPGTKLSSYVTAGVDGATNLTRTTLLAYRWGNMTYTTYSTTPGPNYGVFQIAEYPAFLLSPISLSAGTFQRFSRAAYDRDDSSYYYGTFASSTEIADTTQIGELSAVVAPSATFYSRNASKALTLTPEEIAPKEGISVSTSTKMFTAAGPLMSSIGGSGYGPFHAINTARIDMVSDGTDVFIGGGGGPIYRYDGNTTNILGAYPLDGRTLTSSTLNHQLDLNDGGVGSLPAGTYKYMITHVYTAASGEVVEGEPTAVYSITIGASRQITIGWEEGSGIITSPVTGGYNFPTSSSGRIYRTKAGGDVFYLLTTLTKAQFAVPFPVAIHTDNALDSTLTTQYTITAYTRYPTPATTHSITLHQGRLVALASSSNFWFTSYSTPMYNTGYTNAEAPYEPPIAPTAPTVVFSPASSHHYLPPENSFTLPTNDTPIGVISVDNTLYVFLDKSVWYVQGVLSSDVGSYTVHQLTGDIGCTSPRSIVRVGQSVFFMSQQGLAEISGTTISFQVGDPLQRELSDSAAVACYSWNALGLLLVSANTYVRYYADRSSTNFIPAAGRPNAARPYAYYVTAKPRTFVYSFNAKKWAVWDIDCYNGAAEYGDDLIFLPSLPSATTPDAPVVAQRMSTACNWTDSGVPFTARYYTQWYDGGNPTTDKSFNRGQIFSTDTAEAGGQGFKLTVRSERDWQQGLTVDEMELLDFKVDHAYAEQPYDSQPYGDPELSEKVFPLSNQKMKSMRLVIENSEPNRNIAINGVSVEVAPKYVNMKDE